jgi:hypothetical protein
LDLGACGGDALERPGREPYLFEGVAGSPCLHTDIEDAPVRGSPTLSSLASQVRDMAEQPLRRGLRVFCEPPRIENQPMRVGHTVRRQWPICPRPRGSERRERAARPHIQIDVQEAGIFHAGRARVGNASWFAGLFLRQRPASSFPHVGRSLSDEHPSSSRSAYQIAVLLSRSRFSPPLVQPLLHSSGYQLASFRAPHASPQQFIVTRVPVPDVRTYRQFNCPRLKLFRCRRPANPTRILLARVFCNLPLFASWTLGPQFAHALRKPIHVCGIQFLSPFGGALPHALTSLCVRQTFLLRTRQRLFFDKHTLPLVPFAAPAEAHDHRMQRRVAARAPRQRGISSLENTR